MGLTNEERITKMYWAVHYLSMDCRDLEPGYPEGPFLHLKALGERLWHALLGGQNNGVFWIFGGALDNPVKGPTSPWGVIVEAQCDEARRQDEHSVGGIIDAQCFDPFRGFLDIQGLAGHSCGGETCRKVFSIYLGVESLIYGLRRYGDDLRAKFPELDKLCSDILGACFAVMEGDDTYSKAYVGERLFQWIYGEWEGPVWKALNAVNMHHNLSRVMEDCTLAEVIAWDKWRLTHKDKDTVQNRLVLALRMAGRHFHYEHQFEKFIKEFRGMGVRVKVLEQEFAKCAKAHDERGGKRQEESVGQTRVEETAVIHGYNYDLKWEKDR